MSNLTKDTTFLISKAIYADLTKIFGEIYFFFDNKTKKIVSELSEDIKINLEKGIINYSNRKLIIDPEYIDSFKKFFASDRQKRSLLIRLKMDEAAFYEWFAVEIFKRDDTDIFIGRIKNINDTVKEREAIIKKGLLDPLTQILQKEAIETQVSEFLATKPVGNHIFVMLDIDYFKNINDNYGHLFGDYVIKAVAEVLKKIGGKDSKVGRLGGDEFALFIKDVNSREEIKAIARKIRYEFDNLLIRNQIFRCSSTIGISQYPKDGTDYETLFLKSDKALYRGKTKGRDCHIIYDEQLHGSLKRGDITCEENTTHSSSRVAYITNVLDTLLNADDLNKGIDISLVETGNFFNLHRISIFFMKNQSSGLNVYKEWYANNSQKYAHLPFEDIDFSMYLDMFVSDNLMFFNDTNLFKTTNKALYKGFCESHVSSGVAVLLFRNEEIIGMIFFSMHDEKRVWSSDEILNLATVAKIFNVFINRVKLYD